MARQFSANSNSALILEAKIMRDRRDRDKLPNGPHSCLTSAETRPLKCILFVVNKESFNFLAVSYEIPLVSRTGTR